MISNCLEPRPVLQVGKVLGGDCLSAGQVGDCARLLEHPVVSAGGELELGHGGFHQGAPGFVSSQENPITYYQ
jgi:hypothetical protein